MQKIYSLLRSNKQSGPYTLEELLQLNLKPFDLIWVEGKSGGWSYPTEIEALKMYVSPATKPTEKKEIATSVEPTSAPIIPTTEAASPSRTNGKHIYISLPAGKQIILENITAKPSVEPFEETPEAKLERKAQELRNKIQAFAENKNALKADNDLDTRYSRPLDDIKEEYSSWLYQQKKKKKFPTKYIVSTVAVTILLATAYFLFPMFSGSRQNNSTILMSQNRSNSLSQSDSSASEEKQVTTKKRVIKSEKPSKKTKQNAAYAKPTRVYTNEEIDKVDAYLDSLKQTSEKNGTSEEIVYQPSSTENNGTRQSTKRSTEPTEKTRSDQSENDAVPFTELIKLSESTGSGTSHLSLYNNSNKYIKFVAVDVCYYKADQKLLLKKTLYFNDISPNSSARLYLPQERKAVSVKYEMGLISTDSGLYYAKQ